MSWAAYAFIDQKQSGSRHLSGSEPGRWEAVVRQSLPLIVADGDVPFGVLSDVADIKFCEMKEVEKTGRFLRGRIFGALGELRWRPWCRGRHAVLLTDAETDLRSLREMGFDDGAALDLVAEEPVPYLLWGELEEDGKWRDGRIPRDLAYPVACESCTDRVWLQARRYVDEAGVAQFVRYVGVTSRERESW